MRNKRSFADKLLDLLDHIEYRRIETSEDMEDVARLRYKAYKKADLIPLGGGDKLIEDIDFDSHAYVFGVYFEEQLISTVRVHHVTPEHRICSSIKAVPEPLNAFLDAGMSFLDPVRFAADPEVLGRMPATPWFALRIVPMASDYFHVDRTIQVVTPNHAPFYQRVFDSTVIAGPQKENSGAIKVEFTTLSAVTQEVLPRLYERFPFFQSEPFERRMMFERNDHSLPLLNVLPTARFALRHVKPINGNAGRTDSNAVRLPN